MVWIAFGCALCTSIFFLVKKEFLYFATVVIILVVSIPVYFYFDFVEKKSKSIVLYLDYSESSIYKVKNVEDKLKNLNFDFIRYFGKPFNKDDDFDVLSSDNINIIVSDFLFDIPSKITNSKNNIFVSLGSSVKTNHLIRRVYMTNLSQVEYLSIEMFMPSDITIKDKKGRILFSGKNKGLYFVPLNSLPSEISLFSLNTNISLSLEKRKNLGVVWFEPNQDLTKLLRVLKNMNYDYDLFVKLDKNFSYKSYDYMIFGYPDVPFKEILRSTPINSRIVILSPSENLLKDLVSFSKLRSIKLSKDDFYYLEDLGVFNFYFGYPVNLVEVYKFSFPKVSSKIIPLDRIGFSFYFEIFGRKFLFFSARYVYRIDAENYKVGIYSTFSEDLYTEFLKFLFKEEEEKSFQEINLSESAFEGARMFDKAFFVEKLDNKFIENLRKSYSEDRIVSNKIDFSTFWWLMVLIIVAIGFKWFIEG